MRTKTKIPKHLLPFIGFIAPALILYSVFFLLPLGLTFFFSLTNYDGWKVMDFIGFKNYLRLFKDKEFYNTMIRTAIYVVCTLPFKVIIPLALAMLVTSKYLKIKTFVRSAFYIPVLLSPLIVGITINWMFGQEYGLVNFIISSFGAQPLSWSLNGTLATIVIIIASSWSSAGFYMIIFIGGITNISGEIYEAADIDGATAWQKFSKITFPLISPTTFLVLLLCTINLIKEYALVQGITMGGPGTKTTFIIQYIFDKGFKSFEYGYASAISLVLMLICILITLIQFKMNNGGENV